MTIDERARTLKAAAKGRWPEILMALAAAPAEMFNGRHQPCPKCGGTDRFCWKKSEEYAFCNQCFNAKNGDGISALQWLQDKSYEEACKAVANYLNVEWPKKGKSGENGKASKTSGKESEGVYASPGHALKSILASCAADHNNIEANPQEKPRYSRHWKYETFIVVRIDLPTRPGEKRRKTFRPIHEVTLPNGGTAWKLGYPPNKRPLYRLPELLGSTEGGDGVVVVCGGEKATDASWGLGLVATTCAGGEKAAKETDWSPLSKFQQVVISIDNDAAGHEYGAAVSAELARLNPAPTTKVLLLPGLPEKGDIVEWIAAGGTKEEFLKLAAEAMAPDPLDIFRSACESIGLNISGEWEDGSIQVFSIPNRKMDRIRDIEHLTYSKLMQINGETVKSKVYQGKEEIPGLIPFVRIKEAIAIMAGKRRLTDQTFLGAGCWRGKDKNNNPDQSIVLVGAGEAALWNGQGDLERVTNNECKGLILNFSGFDPWYDHQRLNEYIHKAGDREWARQVVEEQVVHLFQRWRWEQEQIPFIIAGLVLSTWVQALWEWRPQVALIGASKTGKSTLFKALDEMFGGLSVKSSMSSAPGIRQAIQTSSRVILCDEFESSNHRQEILSMLRASGRGDQILRGTSSQKGKGYCLRHIAWVAATEVGLKKEVDRNRFIMLKLMRPKVDEQGKLVIPTTHESRELGQKTLAIAIRYVNHAVPLAVRLRSVKVKDIDERVIESFSVPAAMLSSVADFTWDQSVECLKNLVIGVAESKDTSADEEDLLRGILNAVVDTRGGKKSVGQLLQIALSAPTSGFSEPEATDTLDRVGIKIGPKDKAGTTSAKCLIIAYEVVLEQLLKRTPWENQCIDQILRRIETAVVSRRRVSGNRQPVVLIELNVIKKLHMDAPEEED